MRCAIEAGSCRFSAGHAAQGTAWQLLHQQSVDLLAVLVPAPAPMDAPLLPPRPEPELLDEEPSVVPLGLEELELAVGLEELLGLDELELPLGLEALELLPGLDDAVVLEEPMLLVALGELELLEADGPLDDVEADGLELLLPDEPIVLLLGLDDEALELPLFRQGWVLPLEAPMLLLLPVLEDPVEPVEPAEPAEPDELGLLAPGLVPGEPVELPEEDCACTAADATARAALAARTASLWVLVMSEVLRLNHVEEVPPVPLTQGVRQTGRGNAIRWLPHHGDALPCVLRQVVCPGKTAGAIQPRPLPG